MCIRDSLVTGRLPFHSVDQDGAAPSAVLGQGELDGGGETGPAPTGQTGGLQLGTEGVAPGAAPVGRQWSRTERGQMTCQVSRVAEQPVARRCGECVAGRCV